jgi:hypothetical protein
MGLLTGDIANAVYLGFKGRLLSGTLTRLTPSTTKNDLGDPVSETPTSYTCEGFVDGYSAYIRATAGIPKTDSKVCIFAKSLPAGVRPQQDDIVVFTTRPSGMQSTWQLRPGMTVDPAGALWECQAYVPAS